MMVNDSVANVASFYRTSGILFQVMIIFKLQVACLITTRFIDSRDENVAILRQDIQYID